MFVLLLVAMVFALFFTHPLRAGIGFWISRLGQPLLLAWFVYQLLAAQVVEIKELIRTFFYGLLGLLVVSILQILGLVAEAEPHRLTGLFSHANTFGRFMDIILLVSLPWLAFSESKRPWWQWVLWILGLGMLLGSESYNGVLSFGVGLGLLLLCLPKKYRKITVGGLIGLALLAGIIATNLQRLPKWQTTITDSRLTRLEYWHVAVSTIKDHFWTGIGIKGWENQYPDLVAKYGPHPPLNWVSLQPHNIFLDSLLKAGPLGLVAIMSLLLWPIYLGWQLFKKSKMGELGWFGLAMLVYGAAMLSFGLIDDPIWSDETVPLLFMFIMMLVWGLESLREK